MRIKTLVLIIMLGVQTLPGFEKLSIAQIDTKGPSFDCDKATRSIEKLICSDERLSALDLEMSQVYKEALTKTVDPDRLKQGQRDWQKTVRNLCDTKECLSLADENRIVFLKSIGAQSLMNTTSVDSILAEQDQATGNESELSTQESAELDIVVQEPQNSAQSGTAVPADEPDVTEQSTNTSAVTDNTLINEQPFFKSSIFYAMAFLGLVALLLWVFFLIRRGLKTAATVKQLGHTYDRSSIGQFAPNSDFIEAHRERFKIDANVPVTTTKIAVRFCKVQVDAVVDWSVQVGTVDSNAFSNAMSAFQIAANNWEIAKAQHEQNQHFAVEKARLQNVSYTWQSFSAPYPKKPKESNFVNYSPKNGTIKSSFVSDWVLGSAIDDTLPFDAKILTKKILDTYLPIMERLKSGSLTLDSMNPLEGSSYFIEESDEQLYQKVRTKAEEVFGKAAKIEATAQGSYTRGEKFSIQRTELSAESVHIPFCVVVSPYKNKNHCSVHDHLNAKIILFP